MVDDHTVNEHELRSDVGQNDSVNTVFEHDYNRIDDVEHGDGENRSVAK
jgi:hypothetical protein